MTIQLFKWMMALAIVVYLPVLFERLRHIRQTDTKHSEEYIRQRVETIYFDVTRFYNRLGSLREELGLPEVWPDFDHLYCTDRYAAAGGSPWIMHKEEDEEPGFIYVNKIEVIDHTGDQGTVSLVLHNGDMAVPVLLNMVYERNDWFVDKITYNWEMAPMS